MLGLAFSRDRAMQLDGAVSSFKLHCQDYEEIEFFVICKATDAPNRRQYGLLESQYAGDSFIHIVWESEFRQDVLGLLEAHAGGDVLFSVDDTIYVRDFKLADITHALVADTDALGFSLRLGTNTIYCYPLDKNQAPPRFVQFGDVLKFNWTRAELDFGYPLEVSSSVYRVDDLLPVLSQVDFNNPNTLEWRMSRSARKFEKKAPYLLCYDKSRAFATPVNIVQTVAKNRVGSVSSYSAEHLVEMFDAGYRIDATAYTGFEPVSCHQEVELVFMRRFSEESSRTAKA